MSCIYIHIPFCKSRCIYCNFFSTTSLSMRDAYIDAVCKELELRRNYLKGEPIETIYFGGGTPSLLTPGQISQVLSTIYNIYNVHAKEITIECNPDDLCPASGEQSHTSCSELRSLGINRISIGIQTFHDELLSILQRRHTSAQAIEAVRSAQAAGFDNISIDLMFGLPGQSLDNLKSDVDRALSLGIQHLSIYSLQYEEGTRLTQMLKKKVIAESDENLSRTMYEYILDATSRAGFKHYEISNFALPGYESRHNSSYWQSIPYLGIGAGAHSFNIHSRQFNSESLQAYIDGVQKNHIHYEIEQLTETDKYNEHVFTALRTCDGLRLQDIEQLFGKAKKDYCLRMAQKHITLGTLVFKDDTLILSRQGLFISNDIMSDLMYID